MQFLAELMIYNGKPLIYCGFSAIIHLRGEYMKLFNSFKTNKELINQTEFVNIYSVKCDEKEYTIIIPKKRSQ